MKPASERTMASLPNSDGWKVKKPSEIQRVEPRAACPTTYTNAISSDVPTKIGFQYRRYTLGSMNVAAMRRTPPAAA
jgi:hypothetical protein